MRHIAPFDFSDNVTLPVYGQPYSFPTGAIGRHGRGQYLHVFGGSSWSISNSTEFEATLLLTLDRSDPHLQAIGNSSDSQIPCFACIHRDIGLVRLAYRIDTSKSRVEFVGDSLIGEFIAFPFPLPLSAQPIHLVPMCDSDYPTSRSKYWDASDRFVGGHDFIRVGGPPLWLTSVTTVKCECGREMKYLCSLGYEIDQPWSGLIVNHPVFFGEMAFYWMICDTCNAVVVFSQST